MAYWRHPTHPVEYNAWTAMRARCRNPSHPYYHRYGGRGITVAQEWETFSVFLADMGSKPSPQHSLDRINNSLGYTKHNCQWATKKQQALNRDNTRRLTASGETLTIRQWSARTGINFWTLQNRISRGWSPERALAMEKTT